MLAGLAPAAQVGGRIGVVAAQAAEVHDLPHTRMSRSHARRLRRLSVLPLEVARSERVDEVIGDVRSLERGRKAFAGGDIGLDPSRSFLDLMRAARGRDHLVLFRQQRQERLADDTRGAEDRRPHAARPRTRSSK